MMKKLIIIIAFLLLSTQAYATDVQTFIERQNFVSLYCFQHTPVSVGGTLSETPLFTCTIPGGAMGNNGTIRLWTIWTVTNSANIKNFKIKFGSSYFYFNGQTTNVNASLVTFIKNRNATNAQVGASAGNYGIGGSGSPTFTAAEDTTQNITLSVNGVTTLETGAAVTAGTGNGSVCTATLTAHGLNSNEYAKVAGGTNCSTSGNPNGDPVLITKIDANTFTYPCSCSGNMVATFPTQQRYSVLTLEAADVELLK